MLIELWINTAKLHSRFGSVQTPVQALHIFQEETREFESEVKEPVVDTIKVTNEAIDVVVTIMSTLQALGINEIEFQRALYRTLNKNSAKDHSTHALDPKTGKITRLKT